MQETGFASVGVDVGAREAPLVDGTAVGSWVGSDIGRRLGAWEGCVGLGVGARGM